MTIGDGGGRSWGLLTMTSSQAQPATDPEVVVVTSREDLGADLLISECARRGVPVFRFNSEEYPQKIALSVNPADPAASYLINDGREVAVGSCRGIWIRRPQWPVVSSAMSDGQRRLAAQESVAALGGLWRLLGAKCISHPDALTASRWKLPQLQRALKHGLAVPETIVTMSAFVAREFIAAGPTVMKAVQEMYVVEREGLRFGTAALADPADAEGVALSPTLFQRTIQRGADLRVTVVEGVVFPVRIRVPRGAPLDVRETPPEHCHFEVAALPQAVEDACRAIVVDAGLRFGAIDLVEDEAGKIWFLECNPNGEWGWIENATGLPITRTLLDALLEGGPATS